MSRKAVFTTDDKRPGVDDMTLLTSINNDEIVKNLQVRYQAGIIYCYIGFVLIAVNPFRDPGIYTPDILNSYRGRIRIELAPHVYAIAEYMYRQMIQFKANQCSIISGESGAGKTENAKRILQYVAEVSTKNAHDTKMSHLKDMILATNPLLEAFGNAKTLRNNNSSRFGKYLNIVFDEHGLPVGSIITNYLLEKGRVVGQTKDERNFHIFYQFCKGASAQLRQEMGVSGPECYLYTLGTTDIQNVDDTKDYKEVVDAMKIIGISSQDQYDVHRILAAVLWIGNCQYEENNKGEATIPDESALQSVAYLLQVDQAVLKLALTTKLVTTSSGRASFCYSPLNYTQASAVRDALAMSLYSRLFDWIVVRLNEALKPTSEYVSSIGILDIYGFEIFERNSFEQLCINYVNEKLQQIFIELTLKAEQDDYAAEGIQWVPIKFFDNKIVCELIEEKVPAGIFAVLNDAVATVHADSEAADKKLVDSLRTITNPHFQSRGNKFVINHYAGDVTYDVQGITDKNKDTMNKDLLEMLKSSPNQLINKVFPEEVDRDNRKRPSTASDKIKNSAQSLVTTLKGCEPSYIRCMKPNSNKSPKEYDLKMMHHQVVYLGLLENIKVRRAGFAYRQTFEIFMNRFYLLTPRTCQAGDNIWRGSAKDACKAILNDSGIDQSEWQLGVSKTFIKKPETLFILENMREKYWHRMAYRIQRQWRKFIKYKHECIIKIQRFWRQHKGYNVNDLKQFGHSIVVNKKQRRKLSLLYYRKFHGDYLSVNTENADFFRDVSEIDLNDVCIFSCRILILVQRMLRSDKLSVRYLVMTKTHLALIQIKEQGNEIVPVLYKKQSLLCLRSISTSKYSDDIIVLHFDKEDDLLINCILKTEIMTLLYKQYKVPIYYVEDKILIMDKKDKQQSKIKIAYEGEILVWQFKKNVILVGKGIDASTGINKPPRVNIKASSGVVKKQPIKQVQQQRPLQSNSLKSSLTDLSVSNYKVLYAYAANGANQLSINVGDIIEIVKEGDAGGWWLGKLRGQEGWVPSAYIEKIVQQQPMSPVRPPPITNNYPTTRPAQQQSPQNTQQRSPAQQQSPQNTQQRQQGTFGSPQNTQQRRPAGPVAVVRPPMPSIMGGANAQLRPERNSPTNTIQRPQMPQGGSTSLRANPRPPMGQRPQQAQQPQMTNNGIPVIPKKPTIPTKPQQLQNNDGW